MNERILFYLEICLLILLSCQLEPILKRNAGVERGNSTGIACSLITDYLITDYFVIISLLDWIILNN